VENKILQRISVTGISENIHTKIPLVKTYSHYTRWAKNVSLIIIAVTLSTANQLSQLLAHIHYLPAYRKLASGGYVRHAKQLATARNHSKQTKKS